MTMIDRVSGWKQTGIITDAQYTTLAALVRRERVSVFLELSALLYIGVLSLVAGLVWTFRTYFTDLGDAFILTTLSLLFAGSLYYCFSRSPRYSQVEVEPPSLIFDYVLYLGCLVLSAELAYLEFRFGVFRGAWDNHLLFAAAVFLVLAYRFDNRFVLSLALSSLAGWFGLKVSAFGFMSESLRISALMYGAIVAVAGPSLYRQGIKTHFLEVYLHIAANVTFAAVVSGLGERSAGWLYLGALMLLSTAAIVLGVRFKRFVFVMYGIVYGYVGVSYKVLERMRDSTAMLGYVVVTGTLVIISLVVVARRFGREE